MIAFGGNTELIEPTEGRQLAELDGLVFLLSERNRLGSALIVEAKNIAHGNTAARKQLAKQLAVLGIAEARYTIYDVGTDGAFAAIRAS